MKAPHFVDVARKGIVLVHFIEPGGVGHRRRIFLGIDHAASQSVEKFSEIHGGGGSPAGFEECGMHGGSGGF